jgi:hypothetical protein
MKTTFPFWVTAIVGALCLTGGSSDAYAQVARAVQAAAIRRNYNAGEVTDIDYLPYGVRNLNANSRYIICPLTLSASNDTFLNVEARGFTVGDRITCTLFILDSAYGVATYQSFAGREWDPPDPQFIGIDWGRLAVDSMSSPSVLCLLPGYGTYSMLTSIHIY